MHLVNKHGVSRKSLTEDDVKQSQTYQKNVKLKKKEFLHRCISKILFIDKEQFSKMQVFLLLFFNDFVDRF